MKKLRKKVYMAAGYNTISMGTGRKEFHPKKPRPDLEDYINEAGKGTLDQIGGGKNVDESVIGNFMAARFNKQANLPGFIPMIDEDLRYKPAVSVEGACGSGGLALTAGIKAILAETADVVLAMGVEVQNTVKAIYGADILACASWHKRRKEGHAYMFPWFFSNRAGAYYEKYGKEYTRKALATWYKNAIENARLCPTAQEHHNKMPDPYKMGMTEPNGKFFVDNLNLYDCSKVSDAASAIGVFSEEGLAKCGIDKKDAVEIIGFGQAAEDIRNDPIDLTELSTTKAAVTKALENAGITKDDLGTIELHDCFSMAGVLAVEAIGFAEPGKGAEFIAAGHTARSGKIPTNTTGGLVGWGHPTGATGVHQAVTIWEQLTGKAGDAQIVINKDKPYALSINMGGDDKTLVSIVYKRG